MRPTISTSAFDAKRVDGYAAASPEDRNQLGQLLGLAHEARVAAGLGSIYLTSWLRTGANVGAGTHATGAALDFTGPSREETLALWIWLAQHRLDQLGEVIYEQPKTGITGHVHLTLPGFGGRGQVLYGDGDGGFLEIDPFLRQHLYAPSHRDTGAHGYGRPPRNVSVVVDIGGARYSGALAQTREETP